MKTSKFFWLILLSISFLTACYRSDRVLPEDYIYGFWRYQSGVEVEMENVEPGIIPLAYLILKEDGTMSGMTSRNILGGAFRYELPDIIKFDFQQLTRVYDTPWSARFQEILGAVDRYRLEGDKLLLINSTTDETLTFLRMSPNVCAPTVNNRQLFEELDSDPFTFKDVAVAGSCLEVTVEYSGGCGKVETMLIGSGDYMESLPQQLNIRLVLDDEDPCEALVRKTFYFNLNTVLPPGEDAVILHLDNWPLEIWYTAN